VAHSAGVRGGYFYFGNIRRGRMLAAVAYRTVDPNLSMPAQLPVGNNVRRFALMAVDAGRR
jgi:hypothetical protein